MARLAFALACLMALILHPSPAHALYKFGTDEQIDFIQDVKLKGANNEALFLGHMVRTHWFFAGLYVEDAGYVLGEQEDHKRFYKMPTGEELARFQRAGLLPDPLPPYTISAFDYAFGYSLWWLIPIIALLIWWGDRRKKAAAATAAATPAAPPLTGSAPAPLPTAVTHSTGPMPAQPHPHPASPPAAPPA